MLDREKEKTIEELKYTSYMLNYFGGTAVEKVCFVETI